MPRSVGADSDRARGGGDPVSAEKTVLRGRNDRRREMARGNQERLDRRHVTRYNLSVIQTFADKETQQLFVTGKAKRLPPNLIRRALRNTP